MTTLVGNAQNLPIYTPTPVAAASATAGKLTLSQTDFLELMTAQLKNQDPTQPIDNNQMVAQLAQLSTVDGISKLNTTVTRIASDLDRFAPATPANPAIPAA